MVRRRCEGGTKDKHSIQIMSGFEEVTEGNIFTFLGFLSIVPNKSYAPNRTFLPSKQLASVVQNPKKRKLVRIINTSLTQRQTTIQFYTEKRWYRNTIVIIIDEETNSKAVS